MRRPTINITRTMVGVSLGDLTVDGTLQAPRSCRFTTNIAKIMVGVSLESLAVEGNPAERRYALRELRKLNKKTGGQHGD